MQRGALPVRLALIWLVLVCGLPAYLLAQNLYQTLAGLPDGEPNPTHEYYIAFGLMFVLMAGVSVGAGFVLLFPDLIQKYLDQSDPKGCDHCGYDLTGTRLDKQIRCPECGVELDYDEDEIAKEPVQ